MMNRLQNKNKKKHFSKKKCLNCNYKNEYWYGENLNKLYEYCGLIESVIEDAINIECIKICPIQLFRNTYRDESRR